MSWVERIKERIEIVTGDGQVYSPEYMDAVMEESYSMSIFTFKNVKGSLVDRGETKGRRFALRLFFQGDDHLDVAEAFRISAQNKNAWRITHPLYDDLVVHPRQTKYNNTKLNVSEITSLVFETITGPFPTGGVSPSEDIEEQKEVLDDVVAEGYSEQVDDLQPTEITNIQDDIANGESINEGSIDLEEDKVDYRNKIRNAQRAVTGIINDTTTAIREVQEAVEFPVRTVQDIQSSIGNLILQAERLAATIGAIVGVSRNNKIYYETQGANLVSSASIAAINDPEYYKSRADVDDISIRVIDFYNSYLETLDGLQTDSQTEVESYAPDPDVIRGVKNIINFTLSRLTEIAFDSEQENVVINEADSNAVNLSHRFYGADEDDVNLDRFIETNNIGLSEMLLIKKGREVIYYS